MPLSSWEERVQTAMKEAHLAKDCSALGQLCQELLKRFASRLGNHSTSRTGNHDGYSFGRGRGARPSYKGKNPHGKENRRPGTASKYGGEDGKGRARLAAAAPRAATAAAAAAAAAGGGGGG